MFNFNSIDLKAHHVKDLPIKQEMHAHSMHELNYYISGKGSINIEGTNYTMLPRCIILLQAGEAHRPEFHSGYPSERVVCHFSPSVLETLDPTHILEKCISHRPLGYKNQYSTDILNNNLIHSCMWALMADDFNTLEEAHQRLLILSCLHMTLCELRRCFEFPEFKAAQVADSIVNKAIIYINEHLTEDFNLDVLSEICYIEKSYLNNRFKRVTGSTIWEFIIVKRLLLAQKYIRSGMKTTEAAIKCGWNDYSSFYRRYKLQFGISPRAEKKSC